MGKGGADARCEKHHGGIVSLRLRHEDCFRKRRHTENMVKVMGAVVRCHMGFHRRSHRLEDLIGGDRVSLADGLQNSR